MFATALTSTASPVPLNFDSVAAGSGVDATAYLSSFGITLTNVSSGSVNIFSDQNFYGSGVVAASSPHNFLLHGPAGGAPNGATYTLNFSAPLASVSFTRIAQTTNNLVAQWSATAFAGATFVDVVGEDLFGGTEPAQLYSIPSGGLGITSLAISANGYNIAGIPSLPLDDLTLTCSDDFQLGVNLRVGQCDGKPGPWGGDTYAFHNGTTICGLGCYLTALSMALKFAGVNQIPSCGENVNNNPGTLNDFMTSCSPGLYDYTYSPDPLKNNNVDPQATTDDLREALKAVGITKKIRFATPAGSVVGTLSANGPARIALDAALCNGKPVIVKVTHCPDDPAKSCGTHFVLVTGNSGANDYHIADPAGDPDHPSEPLHTLLSGYVNAVGRNSPMFEIKGFITDPPDMNELNLVTSNNAELLIMDSLGRRTGFDATTGNSLREIPDSVYSVDALFDDELLQPGTGNSHIVDVFQPTTGTYTVVVSGVASGAYALTIRSFSQDGSAQRGVLIQGIAQPGVSSVFTVQYATSPGSAVDLVGAFDGGGQRPRDVNKFLTYSNPTASQTSLPTGTSSFPLQIVYGNSIIPSTFQAVLNGVNITSSFSPAPASGQLVNLNMQRGRNVLDISVDGHLPNRIATDRDRLVFLVP
jgi:hypothetical protein